MDKFSKYEGLDVHQETIAVAVARQAAKSGTNTPEAIKKLVTLLKRDGDGYRFATKPDRVAMCCTGNCTT